MSSDDKVLVWMLGICATLVVILAGMVSQCLQASDYPVNCPDGYRAERNALNGSLWE